MGVSDTDMSDAGLAVWLERWQGLRVAVLGDVILDEYLIGRATRLSREAPVPVLEFVARQHIPGGAANPAVNVAALGADAALVGVVGHDAAAQHLADALAAHRVPPDGLLPDATRPTTVKTRVMAHMGLRFPQQVARLDRVQRDALDAPTTARVLAALDQALGSGARALLLSDYHAGLLSAPLVADAVARARAHGALVSADAQGDFAKYAGVDVVKCNADEAAAFVGRALASHDDYAEAARALCAALGLRAGMVVTRGADGATLALAGGAVAHVPAPHVADVFDTVGAGDTAIAALTLAHAAGAPLAQALAIANVAAGLAVRRVGNYAPPAAALRRALHDVGL